MASKWEGNSQNHLSLDLNPDLIKFGSSKQASVLQNSESVMDQAMNQQDKQFRVCVSMGDTNHYPSDHI